MFFTNIIVFCYSLVTAFGMLNIPVIVAALKEGHINVTNVYLLHLR